MRSNYRRIGGYGDLLDDVADLFKSEGELVDDAYKENRERCLPGYSFDDATNGCVAGSPSCIQGKEYWDSTAKKCVPYPASQICPMGFYPSPSGSGTWQCLPDNVSGGAALSAGGGIADFFANLFNGGSSTAAPAVSTGGGTISPGTPVPKMVPGTSFVIPDKGAATSPVVVGTPASSNIPTALLVLGAVGLLGGAVYVATR